ncbi:hypothetical protein HAZT_HAZT004947 [Hyalella azteca]|uniref:Uncharacterized protein n=1 Tax=Hyalella azteca TaxID=294128 RepID=A0A6A0H3K0_HYAAZ|nr:hypothetical protein HAZT_HAZT004947 [Hyalella azteca]
MIVALQPKKPRSELVAAREGVQNSVVANGPPRTSALAAPIMQLTGHQGDILCGRFHPDGECLATAGMDRMIYSFYRQVTSVTFNDTAEQVISGGIENDIKVWDLRKNATLYRMKGHNDSVTGLSLSPDGSYVLSNAMDNTLRIWDVRPFAPQERCVKIFQGHQHNFEQSLLRCSWSCDGRRVGAGSSDRHVHVWDTTSRALLYKLPGHNGTVNEVAFHPREPIDDA